MSICGKVKSLWRLRCLSGVWRARMTLVGAVVLNLCTSVIIVWGSIMPYVISYFHELDTDDEVTVGNTSLMISSGIISVGVFNLWALDFARVVGIKLANALAIGMYSLSLYYLGQITEKSHAYLLIALIGGAYGITFRTTLNAGQSHYPRSKSMVNGLLLAMVGLSGFILNYLII